MPDHVSYNHETVVLDGQAFSQCDFQACRLVYSGGDAPTFEGCRFDACEWKLEGAAAQTLAHLRSVWNAGGKAPVQAWIKDVTGAR